MHRNQNTTHSIQRLGQSKLKCHKSTLLLNSYDDPQAHRYLHLSIRLCILEIVGDLDLLAKYMIM